MNMMAAIRRIWYKFESIAEALDHDPFTETALRLERLEREALSQTDELRKLSSKLKKLSDQMRNLTA